MFTTNGGRSSWPSQTLLGTVQGSVLQWCVVTVVPRVVRSRPAKPNRGHPEASPRLPRSVPVPAKKRPRLDFLCRSCAIYGEPAQHFNFNESSRIITIVLTSPRTKAKVTQSTKMNVMTLFFTAVVSMPLYARLSQEGRNIYRFMERSKRWRGPGALIT